MVASTKGLEVIGLSISMIVLVLAIFTFCHFRNLWNNRTRIHKNLFFALSIQVLLRLVVYLNEFASSPTSLQKKVHNNSGYVCGSFYLLLEYAKTSMFLWIFVDGLYLHNVITEAIVSERLSQTCYFLIGWGAPIVLTVFWALAASEEFQSVGCGWDIHASTYFQILEVPRCVIIVVNFFMLLNVIRVLITKMRQTNSPEIQQVRKALRTSMLLLPFLGTTNYLRLIYSPIYNSAGTNSTNGQFATWSYVNAFLTSFQGAFCALICCFLNGEVQLSIKTRVREWGRNDDSSNSGALSLQNSIQQKIQQNGDELRAEGLSGIPYKENWSEVELSSHNNVDIEHIEIPTEFINKQCQSSGRAGNKSSHSSAPPRSKSNPRKHSSASQSKTHETYEVELNHVNNPC